MLHIISPIDSSFFCLFHIPACYPTAHVLLLLLLFMSTFSMPSFFCIFRTHFTSSDDTPYFISSCVLLPFLVFKLVPYKQLVILITSTRAKKTTNTPKFLTHSYSHYSIIHILQHIVTSLFYSFICSCCMSTLCCTVSLVHLNSTSWNLLLCISRSLLFYFPLDTPSPFVLSFVYFNFVSYDFNRTPQAS